MNANPCKYCGNYPVLFNITYDFDTKSVYLPYYRCITPECDKIKEDRRKKEMDKLAIKNWNA